MARETLRVKGLREFMRAASLADRESRKEVRSAFREVGEVVRDEWADRFERIDAGSAGGLRTRVRARGVSVEQSRRRTTGLRPDYGSLQMRYGLGALAAREDDVENVLEDAIDRVADHFDR